MIIFLSISLNMCFGVLKRTVSLRRFFRVPTTCFDWEIRKIFLRYILLSEGMAVFYGAVIVSLPDNFPLSYECHCVWFWGVQWEGTVNVLKFWPLVSSMAESSKFKKSLTFEILTLKLAVSLQSVSSFKFKWSFAQRWTINKSEKLLRSA